MNTLVISSTLDSIEEENKMSYWSWTGSPKHKHILFLSTNVICYQWLPHTWCNKRLVTDPSPRQLWLFSYLQKPFLQRPLSPSKDNLFYRESTCFSHSKYALCYLFWQAREEPLGWWATRATSAFLGLLGRQAPQDRRVSDGRAFQLSSRRNSYISYVLFSEGKLVLRNHAFDFAVSCFPFSHLNRIIFSLTACFRKLLMKVSALSGVVACLFCFMVSTVTFCIFMNYLKN